MKRGLAAVIALGLAACSPASVRDRGLAAPPTIVSLNPCTDAILAEVADPGQILALSSYSHDPAASSMDLATARRFPAVSGSVEEVLALKPDLVLGGTFMAPTTVHAMERLGLRLEQFGIAPTVTESEAQVRRLAALAGHPERGEALVGRIEAALAANAPPPGLPIPALIWQAGGTVPGQGTLIADLLGRTGFANAAAARGLGQADLLPLEQVLADPPVLIFAAGTGLGNEDRALRHPALAALKETRREPFDSALLWCGGPTIIRAADRLGTVRRGL
ncbi:MAG TPA: ABC transporter substrate-binding protein [Novosphingobium sp.]|nr:ABC transporter substrate-binding protein [Novosphingobium sp.]HQA17185.1 ABC transporter substrate-binding protein [Novosphingobium sp.]